MAPRRRTEEERIALLDDEIRRLRQQIANQSRDAKRQQTVDDSAEALRQEIFSLAARSPEPPEWVANPRNATGGRGTPCTIWSDWHFGEVVKPEEVGGVNEFNTAIAIKRVKRLVDTTIDVSNNHMGRSKTKYPGIVICLGGDMMTGDIHEEIMVTNDRTPQQQINDLTDTLASAIDRMATAFGRAFVPCVVGNHGRDSRKPRLKQRVSCLDEATPILTYDLRWVPAGTLKVGDEILSFDEEMTGPRGRSYRRGIVTEAGIKKTETIRIELKSGQVFYATPEHKFLAHSGGDTVKVEWISAQEMLLRHQSTRKNKGVLKINKFLNSWEQNHSREAGYLAGVYDGEGTLSVKFTPRKDSGLANARAQIAITQYPNECLAEIKRCLIILGFDFNETVTINQWDKPCHYVTLRGGINEVLRFLGTVRPPRLLAKWAKLSDAGDRYMVKKISDEIIDVRPGGQRNIAMLSSSTKTYISDGYGSHNTSHEWVIYSNLERHFRREKHICIHVPPESDAHFKVYNHRYLLSHGDSLGARGGDGIIGAIGPIMRGTIKTGRSEAQIGRDFDTLIIGHWHQLLWLPGCIVNNSLKGYDEFARLLLRAPYSRPSQALWFTHPEHGVTARWELYLEGQRTVSEQNEWLTFQQRTVT